MKKNLEFRIQSSELNRGFTLVELLASIIVLVAVGSVIAGIITSSLRGTNKTTTIENIRQSGNYALSQMSKNIEYARVFNGLSNDGVNYVTGCPFSTPTPPVQPQAIETNYNYIKVTPLSNSSITYNCTSSPIATISANSDPLIDANVVSLISCILVCVQTESTDAPIIKIGFTLGPKNSNNLLENSTPPISFETSVTMRNYKR